MRTSLLALLALLTPVAWAAAAEAQPDVLLITLDTFRADFLGANGSTRSQTPCLDRLAKGGANFTRARAQVPLSLPSHASILTGLHPHSHGLRDNGAGALAAEIETLAEVLRTGGYATAAFIGSFVLDSRFGLDQGFDLYDDRVTAELSMLERVEAERDGGEVVAAFEDWIGARASVPGVPPFLAWIHLFDPHAPYRAPEPFASRRDDDPYAAEVEYTDALVCRVVAALATHGGLDRTVVAVVGDHGEGLGEHRETTHALLIYNSTIHVPMFIHAPGLVRTVTVPGLVRTIDLAPTLLDYLGLRATLGEGVSLRSRIEAQVAGTPPLKEPGDPVAALSESLYGARNLGWSPLFGLEQGRYRFIQAPDPELYDLERDPEEARNLFGERPEVARRLSGRLESMLAGRNPHQAVVDLALDSEERAKLRSLGYLGGGATNASAGSSVDSPADPKTKIEIWERLQLGMGLFERGDHARAARELEAVLRIERDIPLLYEYLSSSYARLEAWEKLERLFDLALARGIESAAIHLDIGRLDRSRGSLEAAQVAFEKALALDPLSVTASFELGELHRVSGNHRQALASYRAALAINPAYAFAWNGLGVSLSAAGEPARALEAFERAAELAANDARVALNLAVQLERMGRTREAIASYERCLDLPEAAESRAAREAASAAIARLEPQRQPERH